MNNIRSPDEEEIKEEFGYVLRTHEKEKEKREMEKMKFEDFTKAVVEKIREYLPETFAHATVELKTVVKNNNLKLTGLSINASDSNICPTIYLEQFFEAYQAGEDIGSVMRDIAETRIQNDLKENFDVDQITEFQLAKQNIVPRLIGRDWNRGLLQEVPYTEIADLAVTYHIQLGKSASTAVTNTMMEAWGVDVQSLHELAVNNMLRKNPSTVCGMSEALGGMLSTGDSVDSFLDPEDELMFVLSNKSRVYGATALLDREIMTGIMERFGEEAFILPSSVHEVIIVPNMPSMDAQALADMVRAINASEVLPDDRLSDNVYHYSVQNGLQVAV